MTAGPWRPLVALALFTTALPAAAAGPAPFRAGAATSNITPPLGISLNGGFADRKATHVHDELHARCLVLDDGATKVAFAVCDSCMLPREPVWRMLNLMRLRYVGGLGNTPGHLQHWSKGAFTDFVSERLNVRRRLSPFPWTMIVGEVKR